MNKKNHPITTVYTFTILSILGLFLLPLPIASRTTARSAAPAQETIIQSTQKQALSEDDPTDNEEEDAEQTEATKTIIPSTKKAKGMVAAPSSWVMIYNLLPQIFVQSFSTGSDAGIGAFTKILIKQLIQRPHSLSEKTKLEDTIAMISTKEAKDDSLAKRLNKYSFDLSETEKEAIKKQVLTDIETTIQQTNMKIKGIELQTSPSVIFGTAASTALIYTASAMMGSLMKIGLTIALQLMVPQTK